MSEGMWGKACVQCRRMKRKCDGKMPCSLCISKGQGELCTRKEPKPSCATCKRRKVKCDKKRPCSTCISLGKQDECVDENEERERVQETAGVLEGDVSENVPSQHLNVETPKSHQRAVEEFYDNVQDFSPPPESAFDLVSYQLGGGFDTSSWEKDDERNQTVDEIKEFYFRQLDNWDEYEAQSTDHVWRPLQTAMHLFLWDRATNFGRDIHRIQLSPLILKAIWQAGYSSHMGKFGEFSAMMRSELQEAGPFDIENLKDTMPLDSNSGYWIMDVDPLTMSRTKLEISSGIANFMNMHPDEMLARLGNCDNALPHSELEFFGSMTCPGRKSFAEGKSSAGIPKSGKLIDPLLVRLTSIKQRDSLGRVIKVMNILHRLTPSEYDQSLLSEPRTCRPLMARVGDQRDGEELLHSANYDSLFSQTFRTMKENVEGQRSLMRLEHEVDDLFRPFVEFAAARMLRELRRMHANFLAAAAVNGWALV
ncbi:hypothetical protein GUITHDRAFT_113593 [Guillardia theta CCMP2712]|uniref:Zn(2)-C6 fungal-type domain-containing protein n=1 Tax=Guillardia theta (strain CCMP2712) TaxID=905079 RepID=L1IVV3_GUITC|nr:hypothetical protein GUITHDRAFT_113593 [Guillardia theta CCMP2712]EKX40356.1 hypothetical protein GUITHDRAFT_113593 [Guillardia theta CCMP2712]|eukprot:XP_005827336.1 hypothetical protein GUITHDRAFT_113593 [Guillardia theta CCMP2712]